MTITELAVKDSCGRAQVVALSTGEHIIKCTNLLCFIRGSLIHLIIIEYHSKLLRRWNFPWYDNIEFNILYVNLKFTMFHKKWPLSFTIDSQNSQPALLIKNWIPF